MSAQDILIAHGEKALVLLATVACGYGLYGNFTNPDIRPADISMEKINAMVGDVERERGSQDPPVLKTPSNYHEDLLARWTVNLSSAKYYASLSAAMDVGPTDVRSSQYYIYEIHPPQLSVVDNIGNLDLTITLPSSKRTTDVRVSDAVDKTWTLEGRAKNKAQWLGVQLEFRVGAGEWQPLVAKDVRGGLLTLKEGATAHTVTVPTIEPWQRHYFRARLIVKATGMPLDQAKSKDQQETILVCQGTYPEETIDWAKLSADIGDVVTGNRTVLGRFLKGGKEGAFADQVRAGESLYRSMDSQEANIVATDSIRFVFDKVNQNLQDPAQPGAQILLSKYLRDPRGADKKSGKWMDKPLLFKLAPGEGLGSPQAIVGPYSNGLKTNEDFTTPYVLTAVKEKVQRIAFYEIYTESRPMGGKDKNLAMKPKPIEGGTEVAILTNTKSGQELSLPRCEKLTKPNKPHSIFYPDFLGLTYNEAEEFKKNPANFKQNPLIPKEPIRHEPDTGPLEDLRKVRNDPLLSTDTAYFELPDGRIVYWEHVNNRVVVFVKPGSEFAAEKEAADKEAADKAADEAAAKAAAEAAAKAAAATETKGGKDGKDKEAPKPVPK